MRSFVQNLLIHKQKTNSLSRLTEKKLVENKNKDLKFGYFFFIFKSLDCCFYGDNLRSSDNKSSLIIYVLSVTYYFLFIKFTHQSSGGTCCESSDSKSC